MASTTLKQMLSDNRKEVERMGFPAKWGLDISHRTSGSLAGVGAMIGRLEAVETSMGSISFFQRCNHAY